jgi:pyruvate kinase
MTLPTHKTKIVATIGPACDSPPILERMIRAGMNVARLNFSHGTFEQHGRNIQALRSAAGAVGREIAVMADLPGPKMRIGMLAQEPIELASGAPFTLVGHEITGDATQASTTFPKLPEVVKPGDNLFLNDGLIQLEVMRITNRDVHCRVVMGGELRSRKGLNLPGIELGVSAFTDHDRECLQFALEHGADAVSQSFVETAADILSVREASRSFGRQPFLFAKIERSRALENIDEILAAADGIMIARGDLGVETPIEEIAILQKALIKKAICLAKPVITATQMLESMTVSRQPTRAESTDVANAILDGTDCVMLSGESANGRYPVEAVETLSRIAAATEPHRARIDVWERLRTVTPDLDLGIPDLFSVSIETLMTRAKPAAVVVPTRTGATARSICRFRLPIWIAAPSTSEAVCRQLQFSYGVEPIPASEEVVDWTAIAREWVRREGLTGKLAILIQGPSPHSPNANHRMELVELS